MNKFDATDGSATHDFGAPRVARLQIEAQKNKHFSAASRLNRWLILSQPFFVAAIFTGMPGKFMNLATTISDFNEVLSGN